MHDAEADRGSGGGSGGARRGRGGRAGLDAARILEVARTLPPEELTMQAVADRLGVDRKALNYHVSGREGLLELVAANAFETRFVPFAFAADASWEDCCRRFATAVKDSLVDTGALIEYVRFDGPLGTLTLGPADALVERLVAAGFGIADAGRALDVLSLLAMGFARDVVTARRHGRHPQGPYMEEALARPEAAGFHSLRRLVAEGVEIGDEETFRFGLEATVSGLASLLAASAAR
ncbi:TetR/AcrR family transcriptional regulator C-terminal domain-containing protein [Yinghuangia aomiensis]|uniref:TetR/AcrR family transcriptional regulator C-terminal domain-containing protein n=1 Tax=Yinghuangia aomiensis TaxID=676205 RepID=A0ABP9HXP6_9ACTN